jgi:hypothetical protein
MVLRSTSSLVVVLLCLCFASPAFSFLSFGQNVGAMYGGSNCASCTIVCIIFFVVVVRDNCDWECLSAGMRDDLHLNKYFI